ncbi:hypothetical protein JVT61DRAFT_12544 [Boletus reticuloceps]|uniref:Uncharacterized protein n=1 Tax=Boletus reticuloceps TaxID=495285 RepID=A0A8I3A4R0_9AGAM|nr:hypothetical protein JVT61DRAFT_12544 [Boletus reticuloceps]
MSSLLVVGFFGVGAGRRMSLQKPGSKKIYHCFYTTSFPSGLDADERYPAEIRVYSRYNDYVLPDNTVVFLVAKAFFALHEPILLEATTFVPVPGDPTDTSYDNNVPDLTTPLIIGLGIVPSRFDVLADGKSKTCTVVSTDYVRDVVKQSSIQCLFDDLRGRWCKTPMPNVNSTVQYYGTFAGHNGGLFRVCVESVALNVGHLEITSPAPTPSSSAKRKWAAFASATEVSGAAPSDATSSALHQPSIEQDASGEAAVSALPQPSGGCGEVEALHNDQAALLEPQLSVPKLQEGVRIDTHHEHPSSASPQIVTATEAPSTSSLFSAPLLPFGGVDSVTPDIVNGVRAAATPELSQQPSAMLSQTSFTGPGVTIPSSMYSFLANYALMGAPPGSSTHSPVSFGTAQVTSSDLSSSVAGSVESQGQMVEPKSKGKRKARRG